MKNSPIKTDIPVISKIFQTLSSPVFVISKAKGVFEIGYTQEWLQRLDFE